MTRRAGVWGAVLLCVVSLLAALACRKAPAPSAPPALPQVSGTIAVRGLTASVRVVRDRSGVPHIYAANDADLFFAQGFVQAQDRLFQMDLWRRASQGRLAEILGANFVDRDAMTRRIQYAGDPAAEWASYGPDARAIADSFVRGINAWVAIAREHLPEAFVEARWAPAYWRPDDLLTRTDAFLDSGGALERIRAARFPDAVADAVRLVGTAPFLVGPAPSETLTHTRSMTRAVSAGNRIVFSESKKTLTAPANRYIVHLVAPGWNVIGATAPWLPGVAIGHNDRLAWVMTPLSVDTQDVLVEDSDAVSKGRAELMRIKGRPQMLPFTRDTTSRGLVIASDRERGRVYVLRWRGFEPGMAAELGAIAIDRARDERELRDAAQRWKMPARRIVFADVAGGAGHVDASPAPLASIHALRRGDRPPSAEPGGAPQSVVAPSAVFAHLIRRFDVGPLPRPVDDAPLRVEWDVAAWDRSRAIVAPGQAGAPASAHYADGAQRWSSGDLFQLWFSSEAVRANAEATLTLTPAPAR